MLKKIILLSLLYSCTASANIYLTLQSGMFAAHWISPAIFARYAPTGTPEGLVIRGALGYQFDKFFSVESGYTYFHSANRTFEGHVYSIKQRTYSFLFGVRTPELFWHYRLFAKFGFAHVSAQLEGLVVPLENPITKNTVEIHFPADKLTAFTPAYMLGLEQTLSKHFSSNITWYHLDGQADVATNSTLINNTIAIEQNLPSINVFMGGISYYF